MGLQYAGVQKSSVGILIPAPVARIVNLADPLQETVRELRFVWYQENKDFLQYNPQLWLYRYNSNIKRQTPAGPPYKRWRGYRHPSNSFPVSSNSKWWGGNSFYADGTAVPPRITEFSLNPVEGQETLLTDFRASHWFSNILFPSTPATLPAANIGNLRPTGKTDTLARRHYFKFRIVIDDPSGSSNEGHGKLFGPFCDEVLVLCFAKGIVPPATASKYAWMINQNFVRGAML
jgi:hypothetical protein